MKKVKKIIIIFAFPAAVHVSFVTDKRAQDVHAHRGLTFDCYNLHDYLFVVRSTRFRTRLGHNNAHDRFTAHAVHMHRQR